MALFLTAIGELMKLAEIKSIDASADDIVVSTDTVVAIDNKILVNEKSSSGL